MMEPRPAPAYICAVIRIVQGRDTAIAGAALVCAVALVLLMLARIALAWAAGAL